MQTAFHRFNRRYYVKNYYRVFLKIKLKMQTYSSPSCGHVLLELVEEMLCAPVIPLDARQELSKQLCVLTVNKGNLLVVFHCPMGEHSRIFNRRKFRNRGNLLAFLNMVSFCEQTCVQIWIDMLLVSRSGPVEENDVVFHDCQLPKPGDRINFNTHKTC